MEILDSLIIGVVLNNHIVLTCITMSHVPFQYLAPKFVDHFTYAVYYGILFLSIKQNYFALPHARLLETFSLRIRRKIEMIFNEVNIIRSEKKHFLIEIEYIKRSRCLQRTVNSVNSDPLYLIGPYVCKYKYNIG